MPPVNYCQDDLPTYDANECETYSLGGISKVAAITIGAPGTTNVDWELDATWDALIAAGAVQFIDNVNAILGDPSSVTVPMPKACGPETIKIKANWELTIPDANISEANDAFYEAIDGRSVWIALFYCNEGNFRLVDSPVTFDANMPNAPDQNSLQTYKVKGMFTLPKGTIPNLYNTPSSLL